MTRFLTNMALVALFATGSCHAGDAAPAIPATHGLTGEASVIDGDTVTLKAGALEAVLATNANTDWHGGGYNGMARLVDQDQGEPLFIPFYAGFNFEHIFDGQDAGFAPRGGKLSLWRFGERSAGIYRAAADCPWGLESMTRFTMVAPHAIDVDFAAVPTRAKFANDYIGMFWASYINNPRDRAIYFLGRDKGDRKGPSRWITATSPAHDAQSTHVASFEPAAWKSLDSGKWPGLAAHFSDYEFDALFFFGRVRRMVWIQMFDERVVSDTQTLRFSQSPVGGGNLNPAWDFHVIARPYTVGVPINWRARCIYKPFVSAADVLREYLAWSGRKDLKAPAEEPRRGDLLAPASIQRTVVVAGDPVRITKAGFAWVDLPKPIPKQAGEAVGVWFDKGTGGANRYGKKPSHWVYWAVDAAAPKAGDRLGFGRFGYPIFSGYRTGAGVEKMREEAGGGEDGTSTGLMFDPLLQDHAGGEVKVIWWYGYEGAERRNSSADCGGAECSAHGLERVAPATVTVLFPEQPLRPTGCGGPREKTERTEARRALHLLTFKNLCFLLFKRNLSPWLPMPVMAIIGRNAGWADSRQGMGENLGTSGLPAATAQGSAARWRWLGRGFAFRQERFDERLLEIEGFGEILAAVGVLFAEHLFLDEVEYHVAHILALAHPPFGHQRGGHRPELLQRVIAVAGEQLGSADMADLAAIGFGHLLERKVERVLEEKIGMRVKPLVAFQNRNDGLLELLRLHGEQIAG